MAKQIWAVNANYVRKNLSNLLKTAGTDEFKKLAEKRMALYDTQPKIVRECIGQYGMGNGDHFVKLKTVREKCQAIKDNKKLLYQKTATLLTD